jgi:hypothetical protein
MTIFSVKIALKDCHELLQRRPKNDGYVVTICSPMHCVIVIVRVTVARGDNRPSGDQPARNTRSRRPHLLGQCPGTTSSARKYCEILGDRIHDLRRNNMLCASKNNLVTWRNTIARADSGKYGPIH